MASKRIARVNEQLKREISELIRTEVRDPRVGIVTVTGVRASADLSTANVYVRPTGSEAEQAECMARLQAAAPFLRGALGRELHVRRVPELRFKADHTLERALRVEKILKDVLPDEDDGA